MHKVTWGFDNGQHQLGFSYESYCPNRASKLARNIKMYIAKFTIEETLPNWNKDQYGGKKGSSTDHVLISLWNVLTGLDASRGESKAKAVVLTGVDFSKSFSRCSFQEILLAIPEAWPE